MGLQPNMEANLQIELFGCKLPQDITCLQNNELLKQTYTELIDVSKIPGYH